MVEKRCATVVPSSTELLASLHQLPQQYISSTMSALRIGGGGGGGTVAQCRCIVHLDLDAVYAQVERRRLCLPVHQPVAVDQVRVSTPPIHFFFGSR